MRQIFAIALNTFREAVRNRILYLILFFSLLLIGSSGVLGELTTSDKEKIIKDLGFAAISWFGLAISVFLGVSLVYNELEKKTIYTIVSKPISRWQFLLGKFAGLMLTIYINVLIMTFFFLFILHYHGAENHDDVGFLSAVAGALYKGIISLFTWSGFESADAGWWGDFSATRNIMPVIYATCIELLIVTSFAILFSSFSTPFLSMILTVGTWAAGRMNEDIVLFAENVLREAEKTGTDVPLSYHLANFGSWITPNLGVFHRTVEQAIYQPTVTIWWQSWVYGMVYPAGILCLAMLIFNQRNFK